MADKSALYPRASWDECIEFVKTVSSINLKAVSYSEVAKKYGLTNPTANPLPPKSAHANNLG